MLVAITILACALSVIFLVFGALKRNRLEEVRCARVAEKLEMEFHSVADSKLKEIMVSLAIGKPTTTDELNRVFRQEDSRREIYIFELWSLSNAATGSVIDVQSVLLLKSKDIVFPTFEQRTRKFFSRFHWGHDSTSIPQELPDVCTNGQAAISLTQKLKLLTGEYGFCCISRKNIIAIYKQSRTINHSQYSNLISLSESILEQADTDEQRKET